MSIGELGMRNIVSLHCDSEREVPHGFHGFSSLQATGILIWSLNGRTPKESKSVRSVRLFLLSGLGILHGNDSTRMFCVPNRCPTMLEIIPKDNKEGKDGEDSD